MREPKTMSASGAKAEAKRAYRRAESGTSLISRAPPAVAATPVTPLDILLVDDNDDLIGWMKALLTSVGHRVVVANDGTSAMAVTSERTFDAVITDVRLPGADGFAVFRHVRRESPSTDVVLLTAFAAVDDAVVALREGAADYLAKPITVDDLLHRVTAIAERRAVRNALTDARADPPAHRREQAFLGRTPPIARVLDLVARVAQSHSPVLITGETGTGKELIARMIHDASPRRAAPLVTLNCAAFPEGLIEAELFGHERGAFTGALRRRGGRFMAANGGTLVLDEVAEMSLAAQAKLLRVLQEGTIEPLGMDSSVRIDVRVLASTHRNLRALITEGRFREDLYFRLNVLRVPLPPLRERRADLALLTQHFLARYAPEGRSIPSLSPRAWAALSEYPFPGNVRELAHAIEHAMLLAGEDEIDIEHLPSDITGLDTHTRTTEVAFRSLDNATKEFEREYLRRALTLAGGKRTRAAALLGISRHNLWEKLRAHGLSDWDADSE